MTKTSRSDSAPGFRVEYLGWKGLTNGRLLSAAKAQFDVFITADQNLRFQQRVAESFLAIVVLSSTRWDDIRLAIESIEQAVDQAKPGKIFAVQIPRSSRGGEKG